MKSPLLVALVAFVAATVAFSWPVSGDTPTTNNPMTITWPTSWTASGDRTGDRGERWVAFHSPDPYEEALEAGRLHFTAQGLDPLVAQDHEGGLIHLERSPGNVIISLLPDPQGGSLITALIRPHHRTETPQ